MGARRRRYLTTIGQWVFVVQGTIFVVCVLLFRRGIVGEFSHLLAKSFKMDLVVTLKPKQPQQAVNLVMVNSITGPMALYGLAATEGAKIAVSDLNEAGGLLDRKLHLITRDDGSSPTMGVRQAREAIRLDDPQAMFGPVSSDVLLAISQVSKDNKTILISHTANSERAFVDHGHRYIFSVVPSTFMEGSAMGIHMASCACRRYVILGPDYEFGHIQAEAFERRLKEERPDVEIVDRIWIKPGKADYSRHIEAIRAARPDAVYCNLYGSDSRLNRKSTKRVLSGWRVSPYRPRRLPTAHDGRICLTNNAAERALRGIALGRKSWLFAGSDRGGERAAVMYTLIQTARLNDVDTQAWLADVLARINDHNIQKLDQLLPWNWKTTAAKLAA
jgi:Periplasmic binding protein/IS66 C-terminal element/Transposase IS66 family